jgi:hypothetical protein
MNIRARIFGGKVDEGPVVQAKQPKGAKPEALDSVPVRREEARRSNLREEDRHRLPDQQVKLGHKGGSHDVQLVNLSGGGAMIEGKLKPKLWDRVELHLGENGTIECIVRWLKGDRVGLEFAHETRLDCSAHQQAVVLREVIAKCFPDIEFGSPTTASEEEALESGEQRHDRRHPLIWSGEIHHDYQSTPVRLRNISETGAMIECDAPLLVGAEPLLDLGQDVTMFATVTWVAGDSVGLKFHAPFDLAKLARARPDVAPARWEQPTYLKSEAASSPWDEQWGRMSLGELRDELESFLRR